MTRTALASPHAPHAVQATVRALSAHLRHLLTGELPT